MADKPFITRHKSRLLLALGLFLTIAIGVAFWLAPPKKPQIPEHAYQKVRQALLEYYQRQELLSGFQHESEGISKDRFPSTQATQPARTESITFEIVSISERKSRGRYIITIRPTYNGAPPPDGILERSVTVYKVAPDTWDVQPILPSGAPPLIE